MQKIVNFPFRRLGFFFCKSSSLNYNFRKLLSSIWIPIISKSTHMFSLKIVQKLNRICDKPIVKGRKMRRSHWTEREKCINLRSWEKMQCNSGACITNEHRCPHRGLARYPSIDHQLWDEASKWILQWDNIIKHPGGRASGCHCDIHKPSWCNNSGIFENLSKNVRGSRDRVTQAWSFDFWFKAKWDFFQLCSKLNFDCWG